MQDAAQSLVAEALDYARRHKVIHRDIKPQNILVEGDADDVQVVDWRSPVSASRTPCSCMTTKEMQSVSDHCLKTIERLTNADVPFVVSASAGIRVLRGSQFPMAACILNHESHG